MLCQLGPRGASSDAGAQRTTRDKYDASVGCSAAKGPGRLRDDRLFSSDDITILVHGKWGFATTAARGLLSLISLLSAFLLTGIKRNQEEEKEPPDSCPEVKGVWGVVEKGHNGDGHRVSHGTSFLAPGSLARRRLARLIHHHHQGRLLLVRLSTLYRALHDFRPVFWCWRVLANSATV